MSLLTNAFHTSQFIFPEGGTSLEFGVGWGYSYSWIMNEIIVRYPANKLIGYDSWQGLPDETDGVWAPTRHAKGAFANSRDKTAKKIPQGDDRFQLVDGFFSESLTENRQADISGLVFVNIDVDIHSSTIEVLNYIKPLLRPGVVIYWDDWKDPKDENPEPWGEHLAWDDWYGNVFDVTVETLEVNTVNQRTMLVTNVSKKPGRLSHQRIAEIRYHGLTL